MKVCVVSILLVLSGCTKPPQYMSTATITGFDYRMGLCEGGTYILIDGHPNPNSTDHLFDIDSMPRSYITDHLNKFPIRVAIDWVQETNCLGNYIKITRMKIL